MSSSSDEEPATKRIKVGFPGVGETVEAKWSTQWGSGKEWYSAQILDVHPGKTSSRDPTFDVVYEDGYVDLSTACLPRLYLSFTATLNWS